MRSSAIAGFLILTLIVVSACEPTSPNTAPRPQVPAARNEPGASQPKPDLPSVDAEKRDSMQGDAVKRVQAATVFITSSYEVEGYSGQKVCYGSGFIADASGLIITNRHVVECGELDYPENDWSKVPSFAQLASVTVRLHSGTAASKEYPATVLTMFELPYDLALLKISAPVSLQALELGDEEQLDLTQKVWAAGFPQGRNLESTLETLKLSKNANGPDISIRGGEVSSLRRDDAGKVKIIETTCPFEHGNSGGPLVDGSGKVVGINTYLLNPKDPTSRSNASLPARHVHQHLASTLEAFARVRQAGDEPKTIKVDPADGPIRTLSEALKQHLDGDTIEIAAGTFKLDEDLNFTISDLVTIRGAANGKTNIETTSCLNFKLTGNGCLFVADMTVSHAAHSVDYSSVRVAGSGTCYFTRLRCAALRSGNRIGALEIADSAIVHAFSCALSTFKTSGDSSVLRLGLVESGNSIFDYPTVSAGTVALFGCKMQQLIVQDGNVSLHGCDLRRTSPTHSDMEVWGGNCVASGCVMGALQAGGGVSPVTIHFDRCYHTCSEAKILANASARFEYCQFVSGGTSSISCAESSTCVVAVWGCVFWFPELQTSMTIPEGTLDDRMRECVYGLTIGKGATARCEYCTFICPVDAIPVSPAPDAGIFEADGNRVRIG